MMLTIYVLVFTISAIALLFSLYRYLFHQQFIKEPELLGNFIRKYTFWEATRRSYAYYCPKHINDGINIIIALHGSQDTGMVFRKRTGYELDVIADREDFIVVYPDGYRKSWNDCRKHARYPSKKKQMDDYGFLKHIVKELSIELELVTGHIFLFGYSNGGQLVNRICFENPGWPSAVCVMHANLPVPENTDCEMKDIFVPMILLGGTEDKTNPYKGGLVNVLGIKKLGYVRSAKESVEYWLTLHGKLDFRQEFVSGSSELVSDTEIDKKAWIDKDGKVHLLQYVVKGGGHTIPNIKTNFPRVLGNTNKDLSFYEEACKFFSNHE